MTYDGTTPSGEELRAAREAMGLTQQALADALGIPANTIARWERGELAIAHPGLLGLALKELQRRIRRRRRSN